MKWTAPKVAEVSVGMEINIYACATRSPSSKCAGPGDNDWFVISSFWR
jgi:coenzyme PQQ precursor peptide PqqA